MSRRHKSRFATPPPAHSCRPSHGSCGPESGQRTTTVFITSRAVSRRTRLLRQASAPRLPAGLTINPIFDSTILSDPNAALIEATIYAAIADFQSKFSDPITVTINFKLMTTGLGQSSTYFGNSPYSTYLAALKADCERQVMISRQSRFFRHLSTNPVNGSSTINVTLPNLRAVGIAANPQPGQPDGIVYVNTKITNPGSPEPAVNSVSSLLSNTKSTRCSASSRRCPTGP